MTLFHKCKDCMHCFKCGNDNCSTSTKPYKQKLEEGWIVKRCAYCNEIIEKYETLALLKKQRKNT